MLAMVDIPAERTLQKDDAHPEMKDDESWNSTAEADLGTWHSETVCDCLQVD